MGVIEGAEAQGVQVQVDDLTRPAVRALLAEHLSDMHATSPAESVHALGIDELTASGVTAWTVWEGDTLLGVGALKELDTAHGEIKSMRTTREARGRGVASTLLVHLLNEAARRGYSRVSLETGTEDYFAAARRLYERNGFVECGPFADYVLDPLSIYYSRTSASS